VGALNHPNILAVYDTGTHNGSPYLVSEMLEGQGRRQHMEGPSLPQRKAVDYGMQIARGLAAAHEKGVVHRDLKPDNIFAQRRTHQNVGLPFCQAVPGRVFRLRHS
jgi:serine/threonine protein kinase